MCQIVSSLREMSSNDVFASAPSEFVSKCQTHGWTFPANEMIWSGKVCPIGQIEIARDQAIAAIEAAKSK